MRGLAGRVIELGAGDGVKLLCYPEAVDEIILVEPDFYLRSAAQQVADTLPRTVQIIDGTPAAVPLPDGSCDAVVCSLVLCRAPVAQTLAEVRRLLRQGGQLRFYEHARSAVAPLALTQSLVSPLWALAGGGCHLDRVPLRAISAAGFAIERVDRRSFRGFSHVVGAATAR
ncbi:class I SAM-dependent methyltransferase [Spongiactinospora sp. TRM90649]|uniref:class I SAM-dependent methyltransferase n=1 Tax=Spongiactinospora sp. TRM90649 TaxID=3031114 RepID=UPI0023F95FD7|nr:class I SAM-dependent methyltransferase [Spongiactinospora sp. TRM90649]MDF5755183.1 class I SAM-dependent methyltransferase [Spongiactinospora sp. TRM90649]